MQILRYTVLQRPREQGDPQINSFLPQGYRHYEANSRIHFPLYHCQAAEDDVEATLSQARGRAVQRQKFIDRGIRSGPRGHGTAA